MTLTRYHASDHEFDFPSYERMAANKTGHDNGLLGLWVSVKPDWITGFGSTVYAMEIEGVSKDLPIRDLKQWAHDHWNDPDFYKRVRRQLIAEGVAYLILVELDGRSEMGVVVDLGAIRNFRRMAAPHDAATAMSPVKVSQAPKTR